MAAKNQATVACRIDAPDVDGVTGVVSALAPFLSGRTCTPLWPYAPAGQEGTIDAYRDALQCFIFAADDADWALLKQVDEGMALVLTDVSQAYQIERADAWMPGTASNFFPQPVLQLVVKRTKVAA